MLKNLKIYGLIFVLSILFFSTVSLAKISAPKQVVPAPVANTSVGQDPKLMARYAQDLKDKKELMALKKDTLGMGGKAVPTLGEVMKNAKFPEKNRWIATFLLGQIMGEKSAPFLVKFTLHPNWVMRMASLKTLLALKQKNLGKVYGKMLNDESLIVRFQALENIRQLQLAEMAPNVWAMLYDTKNYTEFKNTKKRTNIVKTVINTVGDLKFKKAEKPLLKMVQNKKYEDVFDEMDYSLSKITGKQSPNGDRGLKKVFWSRQALNATI